MTTSPQEGSNYSRSSGPAALFSPVRIGSLLISNRIAVAPMTRVSASAEGLATPRMADYYREFAEGGFGLVIAEGTYTDRMFAQGYLYQPGLTDDAQVDAWRFVVEQVHAAGGRIFAQIMHAGALSQGNIYRSHTVGPSAVAPKGSQLSFYRGSGPYAVPSAMNSGDIAAALAGFAAAATNARRAGFDGVEVHGANGYLLDQFLTEGVNRRTDNYGGSVAARIRLTVETVRVVRAAVGSDFVVGTRISQGKVNDFEHRWAGGEADARIIFSELAAGGADYIHTTEREAWRSAFADAGPSLASLAKTYSGLPIIANGSLQYPVRASEILERGEADVIALARGALANTDWPDRVRTQRSAAEFDHNMLSPLADLANADKWRAANGSQSGPV